jgi:hypothetical protein
VQECASRVWTTSSRCRRHKRRAGEGFRPVVGRQRRASEQAERIDEVLDGWRAFDRRQRRCSSERFEISRRRFIARLRRFEDAGLVALRSNARGARLHDDVSSDSSPASPSARYSGTVAAVPLMAVQPALVGTGARGFVGAAT